MKVFIEADSIATDKMSGIGHATLEIIRSFDNDIKNGSKLRVTIIVPYGKKRHVENNYKFENIKIKSLPPGYRYVNFAMTRTPIPLFVDLWFGRGTYIFPNYKNWHVPFSESLTFIHDLAFRIYPETINPKNLLYLDSNIDRWLRRTDKVLSISKASAKDFTKYFPGYKDKVHVVYLGVNKDTYYRRNSQETRGVIQKYRLPNSYMLYVGNLEPRKNIVRLLEAYKLYSDQNKNHLPLVLIGGDGWQNGTILSKISDLLNDGYEIYHPKEYVADKDMPALYSGAKVLLHLALHEGFGLTALEAMGTKTPVLVSDIPVMHEVAGEAAIYANPEGAQDISDKAQELLQDNSLRTKLIDAGEKRLVKFSWGDTARKILEYARQDVRSVDV